MAINGLLASYLAREFLQLKDKFGEKYPHPWLVWEAVGPSVGSVASMQTITTVPVPVEEADRPQTGDALCFELKATAATQAAALVLTLGRGPDNDIVVNDATVSRAQLLLRQQEKGDWVVGRAAASQAALYRAQTLETTTAVALVDKAPLYVGNVVLAYFSVEAFFARLKALTERPPA